MTKEQQYQKTYHRNWYERNKTTRRAQINQRRKDLRIWLANYKKTLKCSRCQESHPATLDFHHFGEKESEVSRAITNGWSIVRVQKEVEKCEVLCSNCHRKEHY